VVFDACRIAALGFVLAAVGTWFDGWPLPRVFDEFSYLLAGETFAAGRLTNTPHPLPQFFETIHVLQTPTYTAKYFPGHGLFLALGIVLTGSARVGQWMAFAFMAGSVCWMLRAYASRRASLIGGGLFALLLADTNWASGYWGAAAAVGGSALIFGALPRVRRTPAPGPAIALGSGVVILALSRPFEGLALVIVPAISILTWLLSDRDERWRRLRLVALPTTCVIAAGAVWLGIHNHATTGDALRPAYVAYESSAPGAPPFVWQAPMTPPAAMRPPERARIRIDMAAYERLRANPIAELGMRFRMAARFFLPALPFALLLVLPLAASGKRGQREVALAVGAVVLATGVSSYFLASYVGPALAPLLLLTVVGAGQLAARGPRWRRAMWGAAAVVLAGGTWQLVTDDQDEREARYPRAWERQRQQVADDVMSHPGRHLVFVSYDARYRAQHEFVQNGADLHSAPLLWAHDLGPAKNARLMAMDPGRQAWVLHVGPRPNGAQTILQRYGAGAPLP